ncbi:MULTISPECIES: DUF2631 domain-containing protein [Corynebacterium]|uniref:DUF2631 domain-containing protein n=1 Tax=Corynebacterium provencense TaxID=1737425 RepID=A0A2Z3YS15_9CORY|nr:MULTISPECIES: DUF2631 domain-containing protein [Corynebacterium]AWT25960.1 hypothetical protein Csp1_11600 [Corynebacterium provencense]MCI1255963.1 DUF2631 domain-containing protein [Corynebacterium provencense]
MADHGTKVEVYNGVSTEDEPSAGWGWHQFPRKTTIIIGYVAGLSIFGFLFGNHKGRIEDIYVVVLGLAVLVGVTLYARHSSPNWKPRPARSTLTSHNRPAGHVEPNWTADQHNLTGRYADLTTAELRAWNLPGVGVDGVEDIPTPSYGLLHHK